MQSRYHRQSILPGFGPAAEGALARAHVMVVGAGALGCPALDLLARAGVGRLSVIDRDTVELTNLQRQTLYSQHDVGQPKAEAALARLRAVNDAIAVDAIVEDFTPHAAEPILLAHPRPSVVLDCTDNFQTRYLLNDACVKLGIPLVYGGAVGTAGMQMTIRPGLTPCLRCLYPDAPQPGAAPTCDTAGIFAPVSAIIGCTQAADAIKLIVDPGALSASMLSFDLWANRRARIDLSGAMDPKCPCCARRKFAFLDAPESSTECTVLCGRNAVQVPPPARGTQLNLADLAHRLAPHGTFASTTTSLAGKLTDGRPLTIFADGRAIVGQTTDPATARAVYARYVGA